MRNWFIGLFLSIFIAMMVFSLNSEILKQRQNIEQVRSDIEVYERQAENLTNISEDIRNTSFKLREIQNVIEELRITSSELREIQNVIEELRINSNLHSDSLVLIDNQIAAIVRATMETIRRVNGSLPEFYLGYFQREVVRQSLFN